MGNPSNCGNIVPAFKLEGGHTVSQRQHAIHTICTVHTTYNVRSHSMYPNFLMGPNKVRGATMSNASLMAS